ncbi:MAG: hypothetical protein A3H93_17175 [Rhodocyclales bacterium RIFCSPLOWO2_02_FULL_63_24]|nr:MAG: hypothetical protein A2040_07485 [Rhodocyclales bacterium GWA2_65_19]OHC70005.1 MAG: hypothetical protein A3H93_17175 [Rhodocyclales bacterium RIFCSPLOWO2_02_FULL_63_24]
MSNQRDAKKYLHLHVSKKLVAGATFVALLLASQAVAAGQGEGLSGKQVVDAVCANCHATGIEGAPKIGDRQAWKPRAAQGLTSLTQHALQGLRKMPPHGGSPGLGDPEIKRAITYMVNQSGGSWIEPVAVGNAFRERSGEQIVNAQCIKCHEKGVDGAPRIGDIAAWAPRYAHGMDFLVRSAIKGHGAMPPRGGMADLTDAEMRVAALYMFNKGVVPTGNASVAQATTPPSKEDWNHKIIEGMDVYMGVVSAESIRGMQPNEGKEKSMHGGIPRGKGYYHINISLLDRQTGVEIKDAKIDLSVEDPVMGEQMKQLDPISFNRATSYGNYFRMPDRYPYRITAQIVRGGQSHVAKAKFDYRPE